MKVISINIIGKVQGVAFRYYTKLKADSLSLMGTVQNLEDGSLIIYVQGNKESISHLIDWCKDGGSPAASVKEVKTREIDHNSLQDFTEFSIIR